VAARDHTSKSKTPKDQQSDAAENLRFSSACSMHL
jgi:hypothetical protein